MEDTKVCKVMKDLAQLDIDAVFAYEQALKHIDDTEIYNNIDKFRQDHIRHIDNLNGLISKYGEIPLERKKDFKGYLIEGFTSLRSSTGLEGALKAMETNEKTTNKKYREAVENNPELPADVMDLLKKNYSDEQTHLAYIQRVLETSFTE